MEKKAEENKPAGIKPEASKPEVKKPDEMMPEGSQVQAVKPKKEKVSIDPAQRGKNGFDRSFLKGKNPVFRKQKKSGR